MPPNTHPPRQLSASHHIPLSTQPVPFYQLTLPLPLGLSNYNRHASVCPVIHPIQRVPFPPYNTPLFPQSTKPTYLNNIPLSNLAPTPELFFILYSSIQPVSLYLTCTPPPSSQCLSTQPALLHPNTAPPFRQHSLYTPPLSHCESSNIKPTSFYTTNTLSSGIPPSQKISSPSNSHTPSN